MFLDAAFGPVSHPKRITHPSLYAISGAT